MSVKDGGPAFPPHLAEIHGVATHSGEFGLPGMSLRDYLAGQAAIGYLALHADIEADMPTPGNVASYAYRVADAMLAEGERTS